jgi:hypothetical protein
VAAGSAPAFDLTKLLLAGQALAPFAVVQLSREDKAAPVFYIATKTSVNLVKLFGLPSGAAGRISLEKAELQSVLEILNVAGC